MVSRPCVALQLGGDSSVLGGMGLQAVRGAKTLAASDDLAAKGFLARVCPRVSLEMMRGGKSLLAAGGEAPEGALSRVSANVLAKITKGAESQREVGIDRTFFIFCLTF